MRKKEKKEFQTKEYTLSSFKYQKERRNHFVISFIRNPLKKWGALFLPFYSYIILIFHRLKYKNRLQLSTQIIKWGINIGFRRKKKGGPPRANAISILICHDDILILCYFYINTSWWYFKNKLMKLFIMLYLT